MLDDNEIIKKVLEVSGFSELNPVQRLALDRGVLDEKNMVIVAPTASGKTLVSEMAALKTILKGKKVVYIVPLRALATEKYEEFKEKYEPLGVKIAMSIGDYDSNDTWLARYDWVIITSEKFDSLLRHGIDWIENIGLVVADEIHLLDSPERGPTLEVILTRINQITNPKVIALSATINNYEELAGWLNAEAIKSDFRPVKLYKGLCYKNTVDFIPKKKMVLDADKDPIMDIIDKTLSIGKQALVFASTRKGAESIAEKIGRHIKDRLTHEDANKLKRISDEILHSLEHSTRQCERLARCVEMGVAFHHAGETNKQRKILEDSFRSGIIKVITATPTLALGINMPAHTVVIKDLKRFASFKGMDYLPILEIHQMLGRCGRPKYDKVGRGVLLAKNQAEAEYAWENYILGEPEKIYSKLGVEPVLRVHVLALIASGVTPSKRDLLNFFSKTFYAFQYGDMSQIEKKIEKIIMLLKDFGFITTEGRDGEKPGMEFQEFKKASDIVSVYEKLKPTKIGKRVSELYIDPLTANYIIKSIEIMSNRHINDFGLLNIICRCLEMRPLPSINKKDFEYIDDVINMEEKNLINIPREWDIEYDDFIRSIKLACVLQSWIEEMGEDKILDDFNITPGELRARLDNGDWLLYSMQELALLMGKMKILKNIRKLRLRLKYGIKEELLPFVKLKGIGRVKARTIYNSGIKSLAELRKVPLDSLERIVGPKTARNIKKQLG
jgi:helicase